ncbi:unnamed protein product [Staurois parvus]|uniref:Uncharacterized protein n=1 Tax=Staurois parvus TaxID=386267 RepID=A0ABN9DK97_9NEOB|nr:unnamed protein product [Staurois parvus]
MAHIWWDCLKIQKFRQEIIQYIGEISGTMVQRDLWACIFNNTETSVKQYKNSVLYHLISAAKSLIPKYWLDQESPNIKEWIKRVEYICKMEELYHVDKDKMEKNERSVELMVSF